MATSDQLKASVDAITTAIGNIPAPDPTINVAAPTVNVDAPTVNIDITAIVTAINAVNSNLTVLLRDPGAPYSTIQNTLASYLSLLYGQATDANESGEDFLAQMERWLWLFENTSGFGNALISSIGNIITIGKRIENSILTSAKIMNEYKILMREIYRAGIQVLRPDETVEDDITIGGAE